MKLFNGALRLTPNTPYGDDTELLTDGLLWQPSRVGKSAALPTISLSFSVGRGARFIIPPFPTSRHEEADHYLSKDHLLTLFPR